MKKIFFSLVAVMFSLVCIASSQKNEPIHYNSMYELFQTWDKNIKNEPNEEAVKEYMLKKNQEILDYLNYKYENLGTDMGWTIQEPELITFGIGMMYYEEDKKNSIFGENSTTESNPSTSPNWVRCAAEVIAGYFDVRETIKMIGKIFSGEVNKWVVKKVFLHFLKTKLGILTAVFLAVDIIEQCF